jgi:beta-glucosidase
VPERELREELLWPFERAVREGHVAAVMPSYNEIDGVPSHKSRFLLEKVLRGEWGFSGLVVSDYFAIPQLQDRHAVAKDAADAARQALLAGVDVELPDTATFATFLQQVKDKQLDEAVVDRAVARVLKAKFVSGVMDHPYADPDEAVRVTNTPEHRALALEAARKAIVLLKNNAGALPLDRTKLKTLAVIGPNAKGVHLGGYSVDPGRGVDVLTGIQDKVGASVRVVYAEGTRITEEQASFATWYKDEVVAGDSAKNRERIAEAARVAAGADAVVLVLGGNESTSREAWADNHLGDASTLDLPGQQDDLVAAVAKAGKPMVAVLLNGRPHSIVALVDRVPAILEGWYLGQEGGTAVADVLFGDVNPSGKLPISIPRSVGQLPVYHDRKPTSYRPYLFASRDPLYSFGHGLSYSTFAVSDVRVEPGRIGPTQRAQVTARVANTSSRVGETVVQLYIRDRVSSVTRPVEELAGFTRVALGPGEAKAVRFDLGPEALSLLDEDLRRVVEPGLFDVMVGTSPAEAVKAALEVTAQ